jgi:hypothetical protein
MITRRELAVIVLVFLASLPAVTTRIYASDEIQYFVWLRSIAFDHDVNFENDYRHFYDSGVAHDEGFYDTFLGPDYLNEAGRPQNNAPVGTALLWSPFYAAGHLVATLTGAATDGYSHPYIAAVAYGSACYGLLGVLLSISIARRVVGHGRTAALLVWAGTPLLFYMYVTPGFSHANEVFAVSLFLWAWLRMRGRWTPGDAALLGVLGALMVMVREEDALMIAGPALDYLAFARRELARPDPGHHLRPLLASASAGIAACALAYTPQLAASYALNGHIGPAKVVARKLLWWSPNALGVLVSPHHGLFAWTPLAGLCLFGLCWLAMGRVKRDCSDCRWLACLALVLVALQVYITGAFASWTVAGSFGQRRFVGLTPLFTLGLAALYAAPWPRLPRAMLVAVTGLCLWWNLGLMALFGTNQMDRQRLHLLTDARHVFLTLPREAPSLAWRYLFDRRSFYKK